MFNRRTFLDLLGGLPMVSRKAPRRDPFQRLGVKPFINAAGTYTALTASLMPPEVMQAMLDASRHYVHLTKLQDAVGARIAALTGAEAAMVTSGAAGALTVGTAACITGTDQTRILRLPDVTGMKSEGLVQKTHRYGYDHALRATGARMVEIETAEELERAAGPRTAMMLFFNDAGPRGRISAAEWVRLGKQHNVPTFNDAAADVPPAGNLSLYVKMGFDLVTFSGGKGLMGPQSAGLLLGRKDLIAAARLNTSPFSDSLARGMKVNKEEMVGMLVALNLYLKRDHAADRREWERRCDAIARAAQRVKTVQGQVYVPEIANHVPHLKLSWDQTVVRISPPQVKQALAEGEPSIEACPLTNRNELVFGVWMMQPGDAEIVARRLEQVLKKAAA